MNTIAIIDDDPIILEITKQHLMRIEQEINVLVFLDVTSFLKNQINVDLIFLDIIMTPISGLQGIPLIQKLFKETPIIIFSSSEADDIILQSIKLGVVGYILKSEILSINKPILEAIHRGDAIVSPSITKKIINSIAEKSSVLNKLTPREQEVANHILKGQSYKMIAHELGISIETVRMNIKNIYKKLTINSKAELFNLKHNMFNH
jgi:DNA-binding NarL/FixJ family response regulator